ncbi:MAG: flagellar basal body-associated protein FliL [Oligoflexales bacterium]
MASAAQKEEKESAPEEKAPADEAQPQSKKKKLIIFGAVGLVAAIGIGVGAYFFLAGGKAEEGAGEGEHETAETHETAEGEHAAAEGEHGEKKEEESGHGGGHGEKKEEKDGHGGGHGKEEKAGEASASKTASADGAGKTFAFKTFHLNLGNPLENRYIRLEVTVDYVGGEEQKSELDQRTPQLRDAIISIVSRKTREFLLSPDGKDQLRKEILTRINRYMNKPVRSVYITDLLIE